MTQVAETQEYPSTLSELDIRVQPNAGAKMAELMAEADPEMTVVRIFVTGGGCGGMNYGMTFSEGVSEYDSVLIGEGYRIAVDPVALNFLYGAEIDFINNNFVFNNVFQSVGGSGLCGGCSGGRGL